ncbi:MAG: D-alanyl-lipoteichoic acid biosynthesis protein DltD [Bacteroidota bacterium]
MKKLILSILVSLFTLTIGHTQIKVACIGNSITYGSSIENRDSNSYPAQLQQILGNDYDIENFGVSGATLLKQGDKPYWVQKKYTQALSFNPDIVIIKLGTNDSKPQNWKYKDEFKRDYQTMIDTLKKKGVKKIFICIPVPVFEDRWGIRKTIVEGKQQEMINDIVKDNNNITLINLYQPFIDKKQYFPDKIHPNAKGAGMMATIIAPYIKKWTPLNKSHQE